MTLHWAKISDKLNRRSHIICKNFPKISMKSFFLSAGSRLSVAAARSTNLQKKNSTNISPIRSITYSRAPIKQAPLVGVINVPIMAFLLFLPLLSRRLAPFSGHYTLPLIGGGRLIWVITEPRSNLDRDLMMLEE